MFTTDLMNQLSSLSPERLLETALQYGAGFLACVWVAWRAVCQPSARLVGWLFKRPVPPPPSALAQAVIDALQKNPLSDVGKNLIRCGSISICAHGQHGFEDTVVTLTQIHAGNSTENLLSVLPNEEGWLIRREAVNAYHRHQENVRRHKAQAALLRMAGADVADVSDMMRATFKVG